MCLRDALHVKPFRHLLLELAQRADAEVRADEHHPRILLRELVHLVEARFSHSEPSIARSSSSTSLLLRLLLWCHFMLCSAKEMPLPLMVWQISADGRSLENGTLPSMRSNAPTSWPSTSRVTKPKASHLAANGSRSRTSYVLP